MTEFHPELTPQVLVLVTAIFLLSGVIKGTLGIGLPTTAVTLMVLVLEPKTALALVVLPIVVTNFQQLYSARNVKPVVLRFRFMALMVFISLGITTYFTARLESDHIRLVIGTTICIFSITFLVWPSFQLPMKGDRFFQGFFGILSGVMGGMTSIWAPPMVIYLIGRQTDKDTFIAATGFLFSVGSIPLLIGFILNGMLSLELGWVSLLCVLPSLLGFRIGMSIRSKLSSSLFRKLVLLAFLILGFRTILMEA